MSSYPIFLFGASIGVVYGFIIFVVDPTLERLKRRPYAVSDILEEIPKEPALYVFVAALVGAYVVWRWWMFVNLRVHFRDKAKGNNEDGLAG